MKYYLANIEGEKHRESCLNCYALIEDLEIWRRAPKAAARKATAPGVIGFAAKALPDGGLFIYQISGYTPERGAYCDYLNEKGQRIDASGQIIKTKHVI